MSEKRSFLFTRLFLAIIFLPARVRSNTYPWWYDYNTCAWPSLDAAVPSSCANEIGLAATQCLCNSASFLDAAAKGIGSQCGCSILNQSAATAVGICQTSNYDIALDESQIVAAGQPCSDGTTSSTAVANSNPTLASTPSPSSTASASGSGGGNSGGLSPGLTAAVTVAGLIVAIATLVLGFLQYRRSSKKKADTKAVKDPLIANVNSTASIQTYPTQWNPVGARYYP